MKKIIITLVAIFTLALSSTCFAGQAFYEGNNPDAWCWIYSDEQESTYVATNCGLRREDGSVNVWLKSAYEDGDTVYSSITYEYDRQGNLVSRLGYSITFDYDGNKVKDEWPNYTVNVMLCPDSEAYMVAEKVLAMY